MKAIPKDCYNTKNTHKIAHNFIVRNSLSLTFLLDIKSWVMAYGACWEPAMAQFNMSMDLVNKPSVDPSRPMTWWDKIRLLLHGRLTMSVEQMSWLYHASFDPYNTTEFMDWSWTDLILDWTNGNTYNIKLWKKTPMVIHVT